MRDTILQIKNKRQISVIIIYQLVAEKYILKDLDNDEDFLLVGHIILVLVSKSRESIWEARSRSLLLSTMVESYLLERKTIVKVHFIPY